VPKVPQSWKVGKEIPKSWKYYDLLYNHEECIAFYRALETRKEVSWCGRIGPKGKTLLFPMDPSTAGYA